MNTQEQDIMKYLHQEGLSIITIMIEVNALCGLSLKENDVVHEIGSMGLSLPVHSKDLETPVP